MTQVELFNALKATGYPVAYSHFNQEVAPPYIVYLGGGNDDLMADNFNYAEISNYQIELYTSKKDIVAERALQDKLKELEIPYAKLPDVWIGDEKLFQIIYEIQLLGG